MGQSVLVFVSHSSQDKESFIEPIVENLEKCYINVWLDKRRILPGDNIRKSVFREGLDKADIALIFFTQDSLKSSWVDREIKHVLKEESKKGNNFDLNKIISIFDSNETYDEITEKYPELTDDLLHLMPKNYDKIHLGQLISAIWSKYLSLQGGDVETQRQILAKEKEIFQKEKEIQSLKTILEDIKRNDPKVSEEEEFMEYVESGTLKEFIERKQIILSGGWIEGADVPNISEAIAFGLVQSNKKNHGFVEISDKGKRFFRGIILKESSQ